MMRRRVDTAGKAGDDHIPCGAKVAGQLARKGAPVGTGITRTHHADQLIVGEQMRMAAHGNQRRSIGDELQQTRVALLPIQ